MSWDLVWAMAAVALVALVSYGTGWTNGFKDGVRAMHKEVARVLEEEKEKYDDVVNDLDEVVGPKSFPKEREEDEREKTP